MFFPHSDVYCEDYMKLLLRICIILIVLLTCYWLIGQIEGDCKAMETTGNGQDIYLHFSVALHESTEAVHSHSPIFFLPAVAV